MGSRWWGYWITWWSSLSIFSKSWPVALVLFYWALYFLTGIFGGATLLVGGTVLLLGYLGPPYRKALNLFLPIILTVMVYQTQVLYAEALRGPIRVWEPYWFDWVFFGIESDQGRLIPAAWWQLHTHPILDVITSLAYILYVATFALIAVAFYYWKGKDPHRGPEFRAQSLRMMWAFFWCNVVGYSTYYWYPAAPPWYLEKYGLGPVDPHTAPSAAGTARFDELFDVSIFADFYAQSANVFGAIPSLHIVYPLIAVYFAFRLRSLMFVASLNYIVVCFGAVYLNHHYVLDLIWGAVYALSIAPLVEWVSRRLSRSRQIKRSESKVVELKTGTLE